VGADHSPREVSLEQVPICTGRLISIDWHQVTDTCRYSARNSVKASDSGQVPRDVASLYAKAHRRKRPIDYLIILSHIERAESNLHRVLQGTRQSQLPVDCIFITERRCGAGGKTEVAQNLLQSLDLRDRACLFDNNLEVPEEGSGEGLEGFGAESTGFRRRFRRGLGGFGAEQPGQVQQDLRPFNSRNPS